MRQFELEFILYFVYDFLDQKNKITNCTEEQEDL